MKNPVLRYAGEPLRTKTQDWWGQNTLASITEWYNETSSNFTDYVDVTHNKQIRNWQQWQSRVATEKQRNGGYKKKRWSSGRLGCPLELELKRGPFYEKANLLLGDQDRAVGVGSRPSDVGVDRTDKARIVPESWSGQNTGCLQMVSAAREISPQMEKPCM